LRLILDAEPAVKSPRLSPLSPRKIEKKLKRLGFKQHKTDGSCRYWNREKDGRIFVVQVHDHPGDKGLDVIESILRNGHIGRDEWLSA